MKQIISDFPVAELVETNESVATVAVQPISVGGKETGVVAFSCEDVFLCWSSLLPGIRDELAEGFVCAA